MIDTRDYDVDAALEAAYARTETWTGCRKISEDVARYEEIIRDDKPEVVIELGTDSGASALWFANHGIDVVTVDVTHDRLAVDVRQRPNITCLLGSSLDIAIVYHVRRLADFRRAVVSLDSCHSGPHVLRELELYADLVTPDCHLVIEDGFLRWGVNEDGPTSPLDAIEQFFPHDGWERDLDLEGRYDVTLNPAGWWIRRW